MSESGSEKNHEGRVTYKSATHLKRLTFPPAAGTEDSPSLSFDVSLDFENINKSRYISFKRVFIFFLHIYYRRRELNEEKETNDTLDRLRLFIQKKQRRIGSR